MKKTKTIWHIKGLPTREDSLVFIDNKDILWIGCFDDGIIYDDNNNIYNPEDIKKWCYFCDLLSQEKTIENLRRELNKSSRKIKKVSKKLSKFENRERIALNHNSQVEALLSRVHELEYILKEMSEVKSHYESVFSGPGMTGASSAILVYDKPIEWFINKSASAIKGGEK